jgi:small neutral amino acid transporter SnatA (MarC family)
MNEIENKEKDKSARINRALGIFILYFGLIVIGAMYFTNTRIEMYTDLAAGLLLSFIGIGMIYFAQKTIKELKDDPEL